MKRQILVGSLILLFVAAFAVADDLSYRPGELIVRFADTAAQPRGLAIPHGPLTTRAVKSAISNLIVPGATVRKEYDRIAPGLALVKLPAGTTVLDALLQFNLSPSVLYAEPNYKYKLAVTPNDPGFGNQWALDNIGQTGGLFDADIDAPEAWDIRTSAGNVIVAVTDTGIDYLHPDIGGNVWINPGEDLDANGVITDPPDVNGVDDEGNGYIDDFYGWDFASDSMDPPFYQDGGDNDPMDPLGHGTHVAGIIAADGNNDTGITGVCWDANLMALKIFADDSDEEGAVLSDILPAIQYAIDEGAKIINASWGGYEPSIPLYSVINNARTHGILFVAAAGNDGVDNDNPPLEPFYPASYDLDNIISVMATDHFDAVAYYSNYGATSVDIAAPGGAQYFPDDPEGILSTVPEGGYAYMQGTSMAAPYVSGASALMWALNPNLTHTEIKGILLYSVDQLANLQGLCVSSGRLNLYNALRMAARGKVRNINTGTLYNSIQAAINAPATLNGHQLVVQKERWYFENIDFLGKNLHIRSGDVNNPAIPISPQDTFIVPGFPHPNNVPIVTINQGQNASAVLEGFSIIDGTRGGIDCDGSSPTISHCIITDNTTNSSGAGIYCHNNSDPCIIGCTISNNTAPNGSGGGIYCGSGSDANIVDCNITGNTAEDNGGGIYCGNGSVIITNCEISGNRADYSGGGIYCDSDSNSSIINSTIRNNVTDYWGGGIYCYDSSPLINNCLIIGNSVDGWDGGGIYCDNASPTITNCTIADNSAADNGGIGGGMCCYDSAEPVVRDNIFSNNEHCAIALYEDGFGGESDPNVTYCLFHDNSDGDYLIYDDTTVPPTTTVYTGADVNNIPGKTTSDNIVGDPMFVQGRLGNYYLSNYHAGQILGADGQAVDPNVNPGDANSPAVDAGSDTAVNLGMGVYSTRTDTVNDADIVDIGYHYNDPLPPVTYNLNTIVINGSITPDPAGNPHTYIQYTQAPLVATRASDDYQFKSWTGTDNDGLIELDAQGEPLAVQHNIVTMNANKSVTAEFERIMIQLITSVTGESGAISPSTHRPRFYPRGTVVELTATPDNPSHVVIWHGTDNDFSALFTNTVTMLNDPEIVEAEFYEPQMLYVPSGTYPTIQAAIDDAHTRDIIELAPAAEPYTTSWGYYIDGIDITITSANPDDPSVVAATVIQKEVGPEGSGRSCFIFQNVSRNTILNGITITGFLNGMDGLDGDTALNIYDGWPGESAYGGAIDCRGASPTIKNCIIRDCNISGGDGGNGAGGDDDHIDGGHGGWPGMAYGGGMACRNGSSPTVLNCTFINCRAIGGSGGDGAQGAGEPYCGNGGRGGGYYYSDPPRYPYDHGPFDLYTKYSGHGGAVYVGPGCSPAFINCTFANNTSGGGTNGISGQDGCPPYDRHEPSLRWKIDNFGGAVYFAGNSTGKFEDCSFSNNFADTNSDPCASDVFVSFGGAVAFEASANLTFEGCTFTDNAASIGGALWYDSSNPLIDDCNFVGNSAYHGGAVLFTGGTSEITQSSFFENEAIGMIGRGGAISCHGANAEIVDCGISDNDAAGSGGGIYISSKDIFGSYVTGENTVLIANCLITGNSANRDGGGIAASSRHADPNIINCTIADNMVTGTGFGAGYGGGLYCSYGNYTKVIDCILWGNFGQNGPQLAIGTGFVHDPLPSVVKVSYSDVQGGQSYVFVDENCTLEWGAGNIHTDPLFATGPLGNYYLSQIAAGQSPPDSPCVDVGSNSAENLGMDRYTTRTDERPDKKTVDMGYHRPFTPEAEPCRFCELFRDGIINFKDFAEFLLSWPNEGCSQANDWCQHADVTFDTYVNFEDVQLFIECWLVEDTSPPTPNPSEWEIEPYPSSSPEHPNSISMTARTATDAWDFWVGHVQYYFDCISGNCNDSGWQNDPNYTDPNLVVGVECGYRVRARDASGNETEWSSIRYAVVSEEPLPPEDHNPPTPDPMTWATEPYATSPTSIAMVATTATDDTAGVEYYFEDFDFPDVNSGWQDNPTWEDTGLEPDTTYTYRVRARDTSANLNETGWSDPFDATTLEEGEEPNEPNEPPEDTNPPAPVAWEVVPYETGSGLNAFANMTAAEATDPEGNGVLYYFECVDIPSINSGWTTERVWNDVPIGRENQFLDFHFRVSDNLGNMSGWSTSLPCY